jgi:hypothetical protein
VVVPEIHTAEGSPGPKRRSFAEKNDMDDVEFGIANFELLDTKVPSPSIYQNFQIDDLKA